MRTANEEQASEWQGMIVIFAMKFHNISSTLTKAPSIRQPVGYGEIASIVLTVATYWCHR